MDQTDASLLARLQEIQIVLQDLWAEIPLHRKAQLMAGGFSLDPSILASREAADALRRSGEALRRLQEENDELKGKTRPSAAEVTEA